MCSRLNYSGRSWDMNMLCGFFFFPVLFWVVVGLCFVALFVVFFCLVVFLQTCTA